ncbi:rhodanese-like domain-containing protein [Candidatus Thorarchaeota archaeon]|nr:MAG: rhodanese-like domain-containing protein [Candidatus Thorarchaeota archaeon]
MFAKQIGASRAREYITKGAMLIDVRDPVSFRDSSLPGAVNVPLRQLSSLIREPKTRKLIFFGESDGDDTLRAAINYAYQFGFAEIFSLGAKDNWNK